MCRSFERDFSSEEGPNAAGRPLAHRFRPCDAEREPRGCDDIARDHVAQVVHLQEHPAEADDQDERHRAREQRDVPPAHVLAAEADVQQQGEDRGRCGREPARYAPALRYEETVFDDFESAPRAFIGLFTGENTGKALVRV